MKNIWILIIGIILGGFCLSYSVKTWNFPAIAKTDTVNIKDTVYLDTVKALTPEFPKVLVKSLDSISIDTISTVVNGKVTEQKYKITIK